MVITEWSAVGLPMFVLGYDFLVPAFLMLLQLFVTVTKVVKFYSDIEGMPA